MKILIIALLILPWVVYSQGLVVSADSSTITFPNQVRLSLNRSIQNGHTYFQMERKAFKAFVLTTNHYLLQNSISVDNVELLLKNQNLFDSTFQLLEKKLEMEKERTILYQNAYEDLKQVSSAYNQQLLKCADDLSVLKKEKDRSKSLSFIKGFLWGTGILGGIFAVASISN
jgi:hypothetical protein